MTEAVQVTRLPSGLTVVSEQMDRVETVSFGAYVAAGTRNEVEAENGVSHFLEHMAFKGTERRTAAEIAEEIENVGGHINAYTAREQTAYYVKLLKEDLALGADIIGDILTHSAFAPEEVERARTYPPEDTRAFFRGRVMDKFGSSVVAASWDSVIFDVPDRPALQRVPLLDPLRGTREQVGQMIDECSDVTELFAALGR